MVQPSLEAQGARGDMARRISRTVGDERGRRRIRRCLDAACAILAGIAVVLAGCTVDPERPVAQGTLLIGEVAHVLTRDQIRRDADLGPKQTSEWIYDALIARGYTDAEVVDGSAVRVRMQYHWYSESGEKREQLLMTPVRKGLRAELGNVVEVEVDAEGRGTVVRVRHASLEAGNCNYVRVDRGVAGASLEILMFLMLSPGTVQGWATLYCKGMEEEGWVHPGTLWEKRS